MQKMKLDVFPCSFAVFQKLSSKAFFNSFPYRDKERCSMTFYFGKSRVDKKKNRLSYLQNDCIYVKRNVFLKMKFWIRLFFGKQHASTVWKIAIKLVKNFPETFLLHSLAFQKLQLCLRWKYRTSKTPLPQKKPLIEWNEIVYRTKWTYQR